HSTVCVERSLVVLALLPRPGKAARRFQPRHHGTQSRLELLPRCDSSSAPGDLRDDEQAGEQMIVKRPTIWDELRPDRRLDTLQRAILRQRSEERRVGKERTTRTSKRHQKKKKGKSKN